MYLGLFDIGQFLKILHALSAQEGRFTSSMIATGSNEILRESSKQIAASNARTTYLPT